MPRALFLILVALAGGTASASAQDGRDVAQGSWVIVGTVPLVGVTEVERLVLQLSEPDAIPGAIVMPQAEAIGAFEATHSQAASARTPDELAELEQCAREMGLQLARRRIVAAGSHLERCEQLLAEVRQTYDVERATEQRVFRACLVLLQGLIADGGRERARDHAELCRLDAIDLPVEREWAAPEVQELMADVDASLAARPRAVVRVWGGGDECDVWLRGRMIGRTPIVAHGVLAGPATLQLICDGHPPGRAHHITLGPGENYLQVDRYLESALRTDRAIVIDYGSTRFEQSRRLDDARVVAAAVGARVVVIATLLPERSAVRLDRVDLLDAARYVVNASVIVPVQRDAEGEDQPAITGALLVRAGRALTALHSVDMRVTPEREIEPWSTSQRQSSETAPLTSPTSPRTLSSTR